MTGMRLGGVDPSILRELSGVYKPFVKAFKELISNAFDADSEHVRVEFSDDFSSVTLRDDGNGMTPFEFRNDFTRIGGGARRWSGEKTPSGRLRIGSKGIGFLALARYCDRLVVESSGNRAFQLNIELPTTPIVVKLPALLGVPMDSALLARHLSCNVRPKNSRDRKLTEGRHYAWNRKNGQISVRRNNVGPIVLIATVNCHDLAFKATLDFDRLLRLADNADLEKLDDFASIEVYEADQEHIAPGTCVTALGLKNFVRRDLRTVQRKGFVRNISSRAGFERFLWSLSRCTPLPYATPVHRKNEEIGKLLTIPPRSTLIGIEVCHGGTSRPLRRPVFPLESDSPSVEPDMYVKVEINEGGVSAVGFLAGYESIVFPGEYRGISIRVRGVSIGDAGFLGAESVLTGAYKAALSQITGEINVLSGLDAADTLNPGRESFYEESEHFKILQRHLIGEGEKVGGYLGRVIATVLRHSGVRSALTGVLSRANAHRRTLDDISAAVTQLIAGGDKTGDALRRFLKSKRSRLNGLADARPFDLSFPTRIGGLNVVPSRGLAEPAVIDYCSEQIKIDATRPEWDWSLVLFDRRFKLIHKAGQPNHPIGEVDVKRGLIFINWGHPIKPQMDERGFLRTAVAWVLAKEAARTDPGVMMDAALRILSFTNSTNG
jgi:hypothetical protein